MATPDQAADTMIANLETKTGKSLDGWIAIVRKSGLSKHGEIVNMLKSEHGIGHGYANLVAHKAAGSDAGSTAGEDLIAAQFSGPKAGLRPIYDSIIDAVSGFGPAVEIAPKKTYVSLRRSKQFGLVQPTTKTRIDVGLVLRDDEPAGRLEASGSFNAMVTHRVRVEDAAAVDAELIGWLRRAWEQA
jgi:hypothetical protein